MKNVLKKVIATTVALSTVAVMSVSAFAATASYDATNVKVGVADWTAAGAGQYTVVVVPANLATITSNDIYYINQDSETGMATILTSMGVKAALADGSYEVRIGTDVEGQSIAVLPFTVATTPQGTKITVKWGDITGDSAIDSSDALAALMNLAGKVESYVVAEQTVVVGSNLGDYKWGDITGDSAIDSSDALAALMNLAGKAESYTVNEATVAVGSDLEITIPAAQ